MKKHLRYLKNSFLLFETLLSILILSYIISNSFYFFDITSKNKPLQKYSDCKNIKSNIELNINNNISQIIDVNLQECKNSNKKIYRIEF